MDTEICTGEPSDELLPEAKALIANLGSSCTRVSEILESKDKKVYNEIAAGLERTNKSASTVSHTQRVSCSMHTTFFQVYHSIDRLKSSLF